MSTPAVASSTPGIEALGGAAAPPIRKPDPLLTVSVANAALFGSLAGVLVFGRTFSQIGVEPIFLADLLAVVGALLSLPRWWPAAVKPGIRGLLLIALALAILTAQSVYRGAEAGYPSALKSACMGVYPLVAVAIAGLVVREPELLQRFARRVLPLVPLGYLLFATTGELYIAAGSGLYLAYAAAWAAAAGNARRAAIAIGTLVGAGHLATVGARRGPTMAIVLAIVATRVATRRQRRTQQRQAQPVMAIVICFSLALLTATVLVLFNGSSHANPRNFPVIGPLVSRAVASTQPGTESGNNVALRLEMWRYALTTTADEHPIIGRGAGHPVEAGLGSTVLVNRKSGVHNSFIGYVFYSGFPSAILVVLAFWLAMIGSWRCRRFPGHATLLGATIAAATTCMTNVALETPFIAGPAWAVLGAAVGATAARTGAIETHIPH